jgi:hypothetical protein
MYFKMTVNTTGWLIAQKSFPIERENATAAVAVALVSPDGLRIAPSAVLISRV